MTHHHVLTPHDAFFKRSLRDPQTAKHLLERYLPKKNDPAKVVKVIGVAIIYLAEQGDLGLVHTALRYFYEVRSREEHEVFWDEFKARLQPVLGEKFMMSIADEIRQEGIQRGMQQGMQRGMQQAAKNFLASGLDIGFVAKNTGLDIEFLKKLKEDAQH